MFAVDLDDERTIGDVVRGLIDAWNGRDAEAFASLFVPSAEYVTGGGRRARGHAAIADLVRQAPAGSPVTLLGPASIECDGAAGMARFRWSAAGQGAPARRGHITCVLVRQGARWRIKALRNQEE